MRSKEKAFWYKGSKALLIDEYELVQFLTFHNWGQFQLTKERTSSKSLFHNNNGILELHNSITLKNWIIKNLAESNDENFEKKGKYYQTDVKKKRDSFKITSISYFKFRK